MSAGTDLAASGQMKAENQIAPVHGSEGPHFSVYMYIGGEELSAAEVKRLKRSLVNIPGSCTFMERRKFVM